MMSSQALEAFDSPASLTGSPPRGRLAVGAAGAVTALAGAIHLALTGEHFEEGPLFGAAFLAMSIYQVVLAGLLLFRPGPLVYRAGIWGSGLIIATYLITRVLPPPTATAPEEVTALGVAATTLELAALILLVTVLPDAGGRSIPIPAWLGGLLVGVATPPLWLFVTGVFTWLKEPWPGSPWLQIYESAVPVYNGAVHGPILPQLYLFLPAWALVGALALGVLVGVNVWLTARLSRCGCITGRRGRLSFFGVLPAVFAAPVCCGVPLAAIFGLPVAVLFNAALFATGAALLLLGANATLLLRAQARALADVHRLGAV